MIDLHYAPTVNGQKIAIMLEETGCPYEVFNYNMGAGDLITPGFLALNPNGKVPVIVDHEPADRGAPLTIFESGAILQYLAEKAGQLMPTDFRRREAARQWLIWQVAGLGPMHGQANHFVRYAPEKIEYAIRRYTMEARRQMNVLEYRLGQAEYLAGEYSIADIACWPFVVQVHLIGIDLADFPSVLRWTRAIGARPAVVRVVEGERTAIPPAMFARDCKLGDEQWSNVFGERLWTAVSGLGAH